jgi:hypothetical protein
MLTILMRIGAVVAAGLVFASATPTGAARAADAPPAWTKDMGMADLEAEIDHRIEVATRQNRLSAEAAADLRLRLSVEKAREKDWRESRTFTAERFHGVEAALYSIAAALPEFPPAHPPREAPGETFTPPDPAPLDLKDFRLTFEDEFRSLSIGPSGGATRWFAPGHGDFGEAHFVGHGPGGPFSKVRIAPFGEGLRIEARKRAGGWVSGLIQTVDDKGRGFSQRYGYFEMRAKLPKGHGAWPAFWLLTQPGVVDDTLVRGEIDVLEQYGNEPDRLHMAVHLWPAKGWNAGGLANHWYRSSKLTLPGLSDGFHRFGVLVGPSTMQFYYDGSAIAGFPTLPEYRQPLYVLVDLAMHEKDLAQATNPTALVVDYVRVYQLPDRMLAAAPP